MSVTLTDTYLHADGTPADGSVSVRWATTFFEPSGHRTITGEWITQRLDPAGAVTFTLDPPAVDHTPAEQYLIVLESVSCSRGHVFAIPHDVLVDGVTLYLGTYRTVPELPPPPSYAGGGGGTPGPAGPTGPEGPAGPKGDKGDPGQDGADAQLPTATTPGQVLQWSGTVWETTDNLVTALNRTDSLQGFQDNLLDDTAQPWSAGTFPQGEVVSHLGKLWLATGPATAGDVPGTAAVWADLTLEALWHKTESQAPAPADPADDGKVLTAQSGDAVWAPPTGGGSAVEWVSLGNTGDPIVDTHKEVHFDTVNSDAPSLQVPAPNAYPHVKLNRPGIVTLGVHYQQDPGTATMTVKMINAGTGTGDVTVENTGPPGRRTWFHYSTTAAMAANAQVYLVWDERTPLHGASLQIVFIPIGP